MHTEEGTNRLLEGLNDPQREAVTHTDGPLLILAGPGSGKTRVVTRRAAYLIQTVAAPEQILAIAFTNKAAREMQDRISALDVADGMTVSTFHAFCAKLLRWYADRAGVARNFTILDREDRRKVIKKAVEACDLSTTNWSPAALEQVISNAKNRMATADDFAQEAGDWRKRTIARIYTQYEAFLTAMAGLDFDDLLMRVAMLLARDEELRERLENRYRYVLIDEYQDTNAAQYAIARYLTRQHHNLCATGDPDQSIYGWRGADIGNILSFEEDYPNAKIVRLEQNYRSTQRILSAADAVIARNANRKAKTLWTQNEEGPAVRVIECEDGQEEAAMIAREAARQIRSGVAPGDIAVFYRINSLSRALEEAFLLEGVAYQIARGVEFYNRKEVKDVLAYLRVLVNPADDISLLRIINTPPRGIGSTTVQRLVQWAQEKGQPIHEVLMSVEDLSSLGRSAGKVEQFIRLLRELVLLLEKPAPQALEAVMAQSGLRAFYYHHQEGEQDDAPSRNLDELISATAAFEESHPGASVLDWLEHASLVNDVDSVQSEGGPVTLMTLHAAKGLEFDVVHMLGLEDGLLPFRRSGESTCDEEEERRLLFVGMTRAKQRLTLSHAQYRMMRGVTERTSRSSFLDELPNDEIEWVEVSEPPGSRVGHQNRGRLPDDIAEWTIGTLVRHPVCGLGRIMLLQRGARRTHVDVLFEDGSRKTWVLEFADLTRVDFDELG